MKINTKTTKKAINIKIVQKIVIQKVIKKNS